jgi:3',5'-cyclic AMP phosphodiesterase CpdA
VAGRLHGTPSITEAVVFHPNQNRHLLKIQICLPCKQYSVKTTIHGFRHILSTTIVQMTHDNEPAHGIHWSYHVPHLPEAAVLTEQHNHLLKTQLQHQPSSSTLQGQAMVLQEAVYACISSQSMVHFLS